MEQLHKVVLQQLNDILAQAPDVDAEAAYRDWAQLHEKVLCQEGEGIKGLVPRLLMVNSLIRFQIQFILGGNAAEALSHFFQVASSMGMKEVFDHFADETRMMQMARILEKKGIEQLYRKMHRDDI